MESTSPYVLMLEGDKDDRWLTSNVLNDIALPVSLKYISDATAIIPAIELEQPFLILLNYNAYPETGLETLKKIKNDQRFKHIPVVILGENADPKFVKLCYSEGANSYAVKPSSLAATKTKIQLFFQYWLEVAETFKATKEIHQL